MFPKIITLKNGSELTVREAHPEDAQRIIDHVNQVAGETDFLTFAAGEFRMTLEMEEKFLQEHLEAENMIFLIAEIDGKIAGVTHVNANTKARTQHVAEMGITVKKEYWRTGVGSALMSGLIDWAKATGIIRKINLQVLQENQAAVEFYKQFGFVQEGVLARDLLVDGEFKDSYSMGLLID